MTRIALCLRREGIACHDLLPFVRGANEEIRFQAEALLRLGLEEAFELRALSSAASKDEIAALKE